MITVEIEAGGHWYVVTGTYSKSQAIAKFKNSFNDAVRWGHDNVPQNTVPEITTVKVHSEATVWFLR